jgi:hypothetical protein
MTATDLLETVVLLLLLLSGCSNFLCPAVPGCGCGRSSCNAGVGLGRVTGNLDPFLGSPASIGGDGGFGVPVGFGNSVGGFGGGRALPRGSDEIGFS